MQPALFLDKDNTLIPDIPYNVDPALITLTPGAGEALQRLQAQGFALVVVTNQSGVARGYFDEAAVDGVYARLQDLLREYSVHLDGFFYCPHHPAGTVTAYARQCACRKPQPGLILKAARTLNLDLSRSWMIGDIAADIHAGRRAGCNTVLFARYADRAKEIAASAPDFVVETFGALEEIIYENEIRRLSD